MIVISADNGDLLTRSGITDISVLHVNDELKLMDEVVNLVLAWNPDILLGYEVSFL